MTVRYTPDFDAFRELAKQGNLVPVFREILADLETPVSAFKKIDSGGDAFLLESVEGGEKWGRYSFLGVDPAAVLRIEGTRLVLESETGRKTRTVRDPIEGLQRVLEDSQPVEVEGLPRFVGGAVGYLAYDSVRFQETTVHLPEWR